MKFRGKFNILFGWLLSFILYCIVLILHLKIKECILYLPNGREGGSLISRHVEQETSFVFDGGTPLDENGLCFVLRLLHFHIHVIIEGQNSNCQGIVNFCFKLNLKKIGI
ncbi:hypothetical protein AABB24_035407 [Solanum stoloniferum]|uniref:Uncharacterized protein n=1 Tax=Solanum stoloniferum TaxID=62892 RepID=A0ABD2R842_9SOLN